VHRVYRSYEELRSQKSRTLATGEQIGIYKNLDELEEKISQRVAKQENSGKARKEPFDVDPMQKELGKIELLEYWGLFSEDGKSAPKEYLITIADRRTVIRLEENPLDMKFKPFIASINIPVPGEFYGDGDIMPVASLIKEETALRNARLDQVNINVNNMWKVDRNAGINLKTLTYRPGGIVLTNDMRGIEPLSKPGVDGSSYRETQQLDFEIQSAAGLFNPSQQTGNIGRAFSRTATGVSFLQNITGSRIELKLQALDSMLFKQLGWMMMMYNRQFVDDDLYIRVSDPNRVNAIGNPFSVLPADAFFKTYDFIMSSSMHTNMDYEKLQLFVQFLQVAENSQPGTVKFDVVLNEVGRFLVGNKVPKFVRNCTNN
jgi:hypothetical protein